MLKNGGNVRKEVKFVFISSKELAQRELGDWSSIKRQKRPGKCVLCVSYLCKAPRAICIQSERSTSVATNNGPRAPVCIDQIRENMCSPANKQLPTGMGSMSIVMPM